MPLRNILSYSDFIAAHPPFPSDYNNLIDIRSSRHLNVNCDDTFYVGRAAAVKLKIGDLKTYHAVSECDSVSVLFDNGKKTMLRKVKSEFGEHWLPGSFHQH